MRREPKEVEGYGSRYESGPDLAGEMTHKGKWRDFTKPLLHAFKGQASEDLLASWEKHFRTKGIPTRRVMGKPKVITKDGKPRWWYEQVKLQIWTD